MAGYVRSKSAVLSRGSEPDLRRVIDLTSSHQHHAVEHQSPATGRLNATARQPAAAADSEPDAAQQRDERQTGHNGLVTTNHQHVYQHQQPRSSSSVKLDDVFNISDHVPVCLF